MGAQCVDVGMRSGTLRLRGGADAVGANVAAPNGQVVQCTYERDWDSNGVLYFLGRMAAQSAAAQGLLAPGQSVEWCNPGMAGMVRVHCGERGYVGYTMEQDDITYPREIAIDRQQVEGATLFMDGWMAVELGPNFQLRPTAYTMRNGGATVAACMTGWLLEGAQSIEGPWHTLDIKGCVENKIPMEQHQCLAFLEPAIETPWDEWPHHTVTFPIVEGQKVEIAGESFPTPGHNNCGFRVFRVRLLQNRMPDSTNLYLQGFELYGDLFVPEQS